MTILRTSVRLYPTVAISIVIGAAVLLTTCSSTLAAGTNPPDANSNIKPGQACDKLNKATQEYKDCIDAQAKSHQDQGKGQQGGGGDQKGKNKDKDKNKGKDKGKG